MGSSALSLASGWVRAPSRQPLATDPSLLAPRPSEARRPGCPTAAGRGHGPRSSRRWCPSAAPAAGGSPCSTSGSTSRASRSRRRTCPRSVPGPTTTGGCWTRKPEDAHAGPGRPRRGGRLRPAPRPRRSLLRRREHLRTRQLARDVATRDADRNDRDARVLKPGGQPRRRQPPDRARRQPGAAPLDLGAALRGGPDGPADARRAAGGRRPSAGRGEVAAPGWCLRSVRWIQRAAHDWSA